MRKEFEMSEKDLAGLLGVTKPVSMTALQCGQTRTPQQKANDAWWLLGRKMGFEHLTVEPVSGRGDRFFTAETARPSGVVIVFDGPPEPKSGRFVEVERDGASIGFGRWAEHGPFWYLAIQEELDAAAGTPGEREIFSKRPIFSPEQYEAGKREARFEGLRLALNVIEAHKPNRARSLDFVNHVIRPLLEAKIAELESDGGEPAMPSPDPKMSLVEACAVAQKAVKLFADLVESLRRDERGRIVATDLGGRPDS